MDGFGLGSCTCTCHWSSPSLCSFRPETGGPNGYRPGTDYYHSNSSCLCCTNALCAINDHRLYAVPMADHEVQAIHGTADRSDIQCPRKSIGIFTKSALATISGAFFVGFGCMVKIAAEVLSPSPKLTVCSLLPVATVFPTATLSVTPALQNSTFTTTPRQFYFDPKKYANLQTSQNTYLGPSSGTIKTAYGSALTGQIYQIWTPGYYANMSYTLEFLGPALSCEPASSRLVNDTLTAYLVQLAPFKHEFRFISWVPTISKTPNLVTLTNLDVISSDAAHIYVVPNTAVSGPITAGEQANNSHYGYQDLLDCSLYNASYTVFFNFSNSDQTINILSRKLLNPVTASKKISQWVAMANIPSNITAATRQAQRICYQSIMEVYGKLLVGNNWIGDDFTANTGTTWNMLSIDWTSRDASQKGLEELFQNMTLSMLADSSLTLVFFSFTVSPILMDHQPA